jgi:nicotinamidase/pyrazinamidase
MTSEFEFDPATALVVVDVQNDFASPQGSLYVTQGELVTQAVNALVERACAAGAFVVYTQDWHPERTPHFRPQGGIWPVHCVKNTWGAELASDLDVRGPIVKKGTGGEDGYSGFSMRDPATGRTEHTELDRMLRERGIRRVVVVGLAEDVCVRETALDARRLGYDTWVLREATRPVDAKRAEDARAELRAVGVSVS